MCILCVNAASILAKTAQNPAALTGYRHSVRSACQRGNARAAVLRRREPLPGDSGRMGGQVASRPSRPLLPPAPPPPLARGCASPQEGLPPPQYRCRCLILWFQCGSTLFAVADGKAKPCRWEAYAGHPKPVALTRGTHCVDYQFISTTDGYILSTRQLIYQIDFEQLSRHGVTNRYSTCNTLATLTGKWHCVHSMCQRGKHFGKNGPKPCRVDRKSAFCAFCVSTRQWLLLRCVCPSATFRPSTCDTSSSYLQRI